MVWLVLGVLVEPTGASFKSCYESCFLICLITPNNSAFGCSFKCLKDCVLQPPSHLSADNTTTITTSSTKHKNNIFYFCKLGCAASLCTNFSSKHNPGKNFSSKSLLVRFYVYFMCVYIYVCIHLHQLILLLLLSLVSLCVSKGSEKVESCVDSCSGTCTNN